MENVPEEGLLIGRHIGSSVTDTTIRNCGDETNGMEAMAVNNSKGISTSNNRIVGANETAMILSASSETTMEGNYFENPSMRGVRVESDCEETTIDKAKFVDVANSECIRDEGSNTAIYTPVTRNHGHDAVVRIVNGPAIVRDVRINDADITDKLRVPGNDTVVSGVPAEMVLNGGSRNTINYQGEEAAGSGNSPTAADWEVGDQVRNIDDDTVWLLDGSETWRQIA